MTADPDSGDESRRRARWSWILWHTRPTAAVVLGSAAFVAAFSPSLLPRPWFVQGAAAAVAALSAYAVGALLSHGLAPVAAWLGLRMDATPERRRRRHWAFGSATLLSVAILSLSFRQDRVTTASLVGLPPPTWLDDLLAVLVGVVAVIVVLLVADAVRLFARLPRWVLSHALPDWAARLGSLLVVVALLTWTTSEFLVQRSLVALTGAAALVNQTAPDLPAPTSTLRSGGPGATQPWDELGHFGQVFTTSGPDAAQIEEVTQRSSIEPVRVYASLEAGESLQDIADTVVAELVRTGGFDRSTLVLVHTTGRGWIDEFNVQAVEYLTGGDSAVAAMQYSFLASHVAVTSDRSLPQEAGRVFFETVHRAWSLLPASDRPRLYVAGESLGVYAGTAAFDDVGDLLDTVDGAVWVGSPSFTPMWRELTDARDAGSPEVAPIVEGGRQVRFVTRPADLHTDVYGRELGPWDRPRVVFLQYPSDPVVWWSPDLATRSPDWIGEAAGHDVNLGLDWWPLVTFWQLSFDNILAGTTPGGHGHVYEDDMVPVWASVLRDVGTPETTQDAITAAIARDRLEVDASSS